MINHAVFRHNHPESLLYIITFNQSVKLENEVNIFSIWGKCSMHGEMEERRRNSKLIKF